MNRLQYFKGKVCTILTKPTARHLDVDQHTNIFVGIVDDVDELGVWLLQINTRKKSFFTAGSLVGIIEETVTTLSAEELKSVRSQMETKLPERNSGVISVESLKNIKKSTENK